VRGALWLVGKSVFACVLLLLLVSTRDLGSAAVVATIAAWGGMVAAWVLVRLLTLVLAVAKTAVRAVACATTEALDRIAKAAR
jgi:hypothetical protein